MAPDESGNGAGITNIGSTISSSEWPPEGKQFAFIQNASSISQVTGVFGGTHSLGLIYAGRAGFTPQPVNVLVDGVQVDTFTPNTAPSSVNADPKWIIHITPNFTVDCGKHIVTFVGTVASDVTTFLDYVCFDCTPKIQKPPTVGIRIDGGISGGWLGQYIYTADVNGDGITDLLLLEWDSPNNSWRLDVIFGQPSRAAFPDPFPISSLDGNNGFAVTGIGSLSAAQKVVIADLNKDGKADILISDGGSVHIIFGQASGWPATADVNSLSDVSNPKGSRIYNCPHTILDAAVGDVNGDGYPDVVLGCRGDNNNTSWVPVVFGMANWPASIDVNSLNGTNGFWVKGAAVGDMTGSDVAVGDFNHDGVQDMAIGAENVLNANQRFAYILWGHRPPYTWPAEIDLASLPVDGSLGLQINKGGSGVPGYFAVSVNVGDLNADGIDDLLITDFNGVGTDGADDGSVYDIFGANSWPASNSFDVNSLNGSNGTVLQGHWSSNDIGFGQYVWSGWSYPAKIDFEDVNGDGYKDAIVPIAGYNGTGIAYGDFFAKSGVWADPFVSIDLNGTNGLRIDGLSSYPAETAGDIDGDGIPDIIIGDQSSNSGAGSNSGAVYILSGKNRNPATTTYDTTALSTDGYVITGASAGDCTGYSVLTGDFDSDGTPDLALASGNPISGDLTMGSVYVLFGNKSGWTGSTTIEGLIQ